MVGFRGEMHCSFHTKNVVVETVEASDFLKTFSIGCISFRSHSVGQYVLTRKGEKDKVNEKVKGSMYRVQCTVR